jgi:hypothetical protein
LVVGIEERVVKLIGKFSWAIRDGERIFSGYMFGQKSWERADQPFQYSKLTWGNPSCPTSPTDFGTVTVAEEDGS